MRSRITKIGAAALVVAALVAVFAVPRFPHRSTATEKTSPLQLVVTPLVGSEGVDRQIAELQQQIKAAPRRNDLLDRLGWAFVAKARLTSDPGYYKLAEQCSAAIDEIGRDDAAGALLRGHVYHSLHRFKDAEAIARDLVRRREFVFDFALLGDALMEQGRLDEAVDAYQRMVDLKPCLQTYSRVAHIRWLKGDLNGAIAMIRAAISAGSPREPEPLAWACTRLAFYELQENDFRAATAAINEALQVAPDYAPALLMRGRTLLAQGKSGEAIEPLRAAAKASPLPEYLWTLTEALRAENRGDEAAQVEAQLRATGEANDPRTFALFLATERQDAASALRLSQAELGNRQDVFTHDAIAWAEYRAGDVAAAQVQAARALAEGTKDARLFYHAGIIELAAGHEGDALNRLQEASQLAQTLLPSERAELDRALAAATPSANKVSLR